MNKDDIQAELFKYISEYPIDTNLSLRESAMLYSFLLNDFEQFEEYLIKVLEIQDNFHKTKVGKLFK